MALQPWAYGPFEILLHAELHYRQGEDFDRRIAMIGFDNAVEVAVTTYLSLHPALRGSRTYPNADVERWLGNFHSKTNFVFIECQSRGFTLTVTANEIIYYHSIRNSQYHGGHPTVPNKRDLDGARKAAVAVFGFLFDVTDVDGELDRHIADLSPPPAAPRQPNQDRLIDEEYGTLEVCGEPYYMSEVLHAIDPELYREKALELESGRNARPVGANNE